MKTVYELHPPRTGRMEALKKTAKPGEIVKLASGAEYKVMADGSWVRRR